MRRLPFLLVKTFWPENGEVPPSILKFWLRHRVGAIDSVLSSTFAQRCQFQCLSGIIFMYSSKLRSSMQYRVHNDRDMNESTNRVSCTQPCICRSAVLFEALFGASTFDKSPASTNRKTGMSPPPPQLREKIQRCTEDWCCTSPEINSADHFLVQKY